MIYLDNAATTPVTDEVLNEMLPFFKKNFGNPSSVHSVGRTAKKAIELARVRVAKAINAEPSQIFFTSGATEANNWFCSEYCGVECSPYEHSSMINNPANNVLDNFGEKEIRGACSHIWVNNETGAIFDIKRLVENNPLATAHTDATQAFGHIPIDVKDVGVDALTLSGHKFHAPKGVGILYIKNPNDWDSLLLGGEQERGLRAGTENVAAIVGMGKACELYNYSEERDRRCREIQNQFFNAFSGMTDILFNTKKENSVSSTLNIAFKNLEGETLVTLLDIDGICVGSGSACNSRNLIPSHVLKAMQVPDEYIYGSIRLSWDNTLSNEDVAYTINSIKNNVKKVRGYL